MGDNKKKTTINQQTIGARGYDSNNKDNNDGGAGVNSRRGV
jgi:hypothetical protein